MGVLDFMKCYVIYRILMVLLSCLLGFVVFVLVLVVVVVVCFDVFVFYNFVLFLFLVVLIGVVVVLCVLFVVVWIWCCGGLGFGIVFLGGFLGLIGVLLLIVVFGF